ncbi:DUF4179 domain-containing protein [Microbacteriaceae bacterium 4G12]
MDFEKQLREDFKREAEHMHPSNELKARVTASFVEYAQTKRKSPMKKRVMIGAAAVAFLGTTAIFTTMPGSANQSVLAPIFKPVLDYFHIQKGYEKITKEAVISKESNGVKVTINHTVFDGITLLVSYTVEGNKPFEKEPKIMDTSGQIVLSDNTSYVRQSEDYGEFKDEDHKVYSGAMTFSLSKGSFDAKFNNNEKLGLDRERINVSEILDNFTFSLNIKQLGGVEGDIKGQWNFDLPIESDPAKKNEREIAVNKDLSMSYPGAKLEKVFVTPLRIYLQGTTAAGSGAFDYLVLNDKGEIIKKAKDETTIEENGSISTAAFEAKDGDTKSITVIPYLYNKKHSGYDTTNKIPVNREGETKISLGSNEEMTITRVEEKDGKTYVYYTSTKPISNLWPFFLIDEEGKKAFGDKKKRIATLTKGKESVEVFNATFENKKLFIVNPNIVYYDQAFTVELNKAK